MPDGFLEQHVAAAPGRLGAAQRQMAVAQEFVGSLAVAGEYRGADADADTMLAIAGDQGRLETGADQFGKAADVAADVGGRRGDAEFVAAQTRDRSNRRNHGL